MAKLNNINFNPTSQYVPNAWMFASETTLAPSDVYTKNSAGVNKFDITKLNNSLNDEDINYIKILHALLIDWDNGQITLNGTQYTISNTGQLLAAIQNANKVSTTLSNSSNMAISAATVYQKIQELENKIAQYESAYIGN